MTEMAPSESQVLLNHFDWNLQRLKEAIKQEQNDYYKGAALQRFSHTYEISIKVLRSFAKDQGILCKTEEKCFEIAVTKGWMEDVFNIKELTKDYQKIIKKPPQDMENIYRKLSIYHKAFSYIFNQLNKDI